MKAGVDKVQSVIGKEEYQYPKIKWDCHTQQFGMQLVLIHGDRWITTKEVLLNLGEGNKEEIQ